MPPRAAASIAFSVIPAGTPPSARGFGSEELVTDLWLGAEGPGAFRDGMQALSLQLLDAKRAYLSIKALDDRLFGDALAPAAGR